MSSQKTKRSCGSIPEPLTGSDFCSKPLPLPAGLCFRRQLPPMPNADADAYAYAYADAYADAYNIVTIRVPKLCYDS